MPGVNRVLVQDCVCVCAWMLVISEDGALLNNNFVGQSV